MNQSGGYARVYRTIFGHPALRTYAEEAAFGWLVLRAAWKLTRVRYKGKPHLLRRGQLALSNRDFARGFGWSLGTAQRFIDRLTAESMVDTQAESGVTIITICNYDDYQAPETDAESPADTGDGTKPSHRRVTEQGKEESKLTSHNPSKAISGRSHLSADWKAPAVTDLPPKAQECAKQWPADIYDREAEGFALYWSSEGRMKKNWQATWANRIINQHWKVMQESRRNGNGDAAGGDKPVYQVLRERRGA